ncbi:MAG: LPS assembly lipoprotein LptE [Candidatus Omnitrophota bacterium]
MNKYRNPLVMFLSFLLVSLLGCGYTSRSSIYPAGTSIAIKPFFNKINITDETSENRRLISYFPLLETKVTNAVVDRFILDGNLKIARFDYCNLILEGEIVKYQRDALQYADNNEDVQEYRVILFTNLTLRDAKTQNVIWQENNFAGEATYYTQGPLTKSETSAVEAAVSDLARRIVERVVESW